MSQSTAPIDWATIRRQLAAAEEKLELALHPSPEQVARILRERSQALRAVSHRKEKQTRQLIAFQFGDDHLAFDLLSTREVVAVTELTPVPGAPPGVLGMLSIRGVLHSIVDPLTALGGTADRTTSEVRFALVLREASGVSLAASSIHDITSLPSGALNTGDIIPIGQRLTRIIHPQQLTEILRSHDL